MTVRRGLFITISTGVVAGLLGGCIGYMLGAFAPDYYWTVFHVHPLAPVRTEWVGFGLGLSQGLVLGVVVGLVIVLAVAISGARTSPRLTKQDDGDGRG